MSLSITQVQNVLRTYQRQIREDRAKDLLGVRETSSQPADKVDISSEGRDRLVTVMTESSDTESPSKNER